MSRVMPDVWQVDRPLAERPFLSDAGAEQLAGLFRVLANPTRLRLLHALVKSGELRVTDIAEQVEMSPQAVSNQLRHLAALDIVASRRVGNEVHYRVVDPCTPGLLDLAMCLVAQR